jgi:hypothetical protein
LVPTLDLLHLLALFELGKLYGKLCATFGTKLFPFVLGTTTAGSATKFASLDEAPRGQLVPGGGMYQRPGKALSTGAGSPACVWLSRTRTCWLKQSCVMLFGSVQSLISMYPL